MDVKQFVPPDGKREFSYWRHLEEEGKVIEIGMLDARLRKPNRAQEIRGLFEDREYMAREEGEMESLVSYLNHEIKERQYPFSIPINNDVEYLLSFNERVLAYIYGMDEYMGLGESEMFMELRGIVLLQDDVSNEEISEIADWFREAFRFE